MRRVAAWALLLGCSAPDEAEYDGKVPGEPLGAYLVTARLTDDECGADLLGAEDPWRFSVRLSRSVDVLYWLNGREAIVGTIDEAGETFQFSTRVDVPLSPPGRGAAGCVVSRFDRAQGKVRFSDRQVAGLEGELEFEYNEKSGTECLEIIGVPGGFNRLPCRLRYSVIAERAKSEP